MEDQKPSPAAPAAGVNPSWNRGSLNVLQFADVRKLPDTAQTVEIAAAEVSSYHAVTLEQSVRLKSLELGLANFLVTLVACCPPGAERSSAISRAREAKMWAASAIALEGR